MSPRFDIDAYRANFESGARAYLFYYTPIFPAAVQGVDSEKATYLVKATSLPESTKEELTTNWQGFDYKFAGKSTFGDWTVTFNVDKDAKILEMFNNWSTLIHDPTTNLYSIPSNYVSDQQVNLLDLQGEVITKYKLIGAWPKTVGSIDLAYDSTDIVSFEVTFTYVYHVISNVKYGNQPTFA